MGPKQSLAMDIENGEVSFSYLTENVIASTSLMDGITQRSLGKMKGAFYIDFYFYFTLVEGLKVDNVRALGATSLDYELSTYEGGTIKLWFEIQLDPVILTYGFGEKNGNDYWLAVVAHEFGHINQFMSLTGDLHTKLFGSGLEGDDFDNLFVDMLRTIEKSWFGMNRDRGHSDANIRARSFLDPNLWPYLNTLPKY